MQDQDIYGRRVARLLHRSTSFYDTEQYHSTHKPEGARKSTVCRPCYFFVAGILLCVLVNLWKDSWARIFLHRVLERRPPSDGIFCTTSKGVSFAVKRGTLTAGRVLLSSIASEIWNHFQHPSRNDYLVQAHIETHL